MKKLFVGNLPFTMTEDELEGLFADFGQVADVSIVSDKLTGRSKGYGFVEMVVDTEADSAVEGLHDHQVGDRAITVEVAKPKG